MPLLPWLAAAVAMGVLSLVAAWRITRYLRGDPETIALIGRTSTGKTTLLACLEERELPDRPRPSTVTSTKQRDLLVENKTFTVVDTSGSELAQWVKAVKQARGVLYFFDAHLVAQGDTGTLNWIAADASHIEEVFPHLKSKRFTLVGTHADLFGSPRHDEASVRGHTVIEQLQKATGTTDHDVIIGSLSTDRNAMKLIQKVFRNQSSNTS